MSDRDRIPAAEVDWTQLVRFAEAFDAPGFVPGKVDPELSIISPWVYAPEVLEFVATLYRIGAVEMFDWPGWQDRALQLYNDQEEFDRADVEELRKLLTTHVRLDRFSDGHLAAMLSAGHIQRILRRLLASQGG